MSRTFKHLTRTQRLQLESFLLAKMPVTEICKHLGVSNSTIYREIKRGSIDGTYSAEYSQSVYEQLSKQKGPLEKLSIDKDIAQFIADLIINEHLSPEKAIARLKEQNIDCPSSHATIYSAIRKGLIPNVTIEDLRKKTTTIFSNGLLQIPLWMRKELNLNDGDTVTIILENKSIIIEKID